MKLLALDGPLNGQYIDEPTALTNEYSKAEWPTGEEVWEHHTVPIEEPHEPVEDLAYTESIRNAS